MGAITVVSQVKIQARDGSHVANKTRRARWGFFLGLALFMAVSVLWGDHFHRSRKSASFIDFGEIYYGSLAAIHHQDPYSPDVLSRTYLADGGIFSKKQRAQRIERIVTIIEVNLPTTLFLVAPFAFLPFATAHALWAALTILLLLVAAYLVWDLSAVNGPVLALLLAGVILMNCEQMLSVGNAAGLVVGLCVVAAWCFVKERYVPLGIVFLAISLAVKPHDVGFVWLFFLLAGGKNRTRALQTLAVTALIGLAAAIWIAPISPHWVQEMHQNHVLVSQPGGTSDPAIAGITSGDVGAILDLQSLFSTFIGSPRLYNMASYLLVGLLLGAWAWLTARRSITQERVLLGLAAAAALTLLPIYHRPYDAKLLLLTIPACAMLWNQGGVRRWFALAFTTAGILITSDIVLAIILIFSGQPANAPAPEQKTILISILPPALLLALGCFYLWAFFRSDRGEEPLQGGQSQSQEPFQGYASEAAILEGIAR